MLWVWASGYRPEVSEHTRKLGLYLCHGDRITPKWIEMESGKNYFHSVRIEIDFWCYS